MRTVRVNETVAMIVPLYMQSIQVGSVCKVVKNVSSMRTKGVNNYTPVHYVSLKPIFMQILKYKGATVIELRLFNRILKKKKKKQEKKEKNIAIL